MHVPCAKGFSETGKTFWMPKSHGLEVNGMIFILKYNNTNNASIKNAAHGRKGKYFPVPSAWYMRRALHWPAPCMAPYGAGRTNNMVELMLYTEGIRLALRYVRTYVRCIVNVALQ